MKSHRDPVPPFLSGVKLSHFFGGLCGGVVATLITHPFDLIKLRLAGELIASSNLKNFVPNNSVVHTGVKTESRPLYSGFYHGVKAVFHQDGLFGLYRVGSELPRFG